ncbi:hypothetical protein Q31a_35580 [Aureliella helgolandensis]|uniref:Uncharacterized protein n=1 Tax=Aureliella helgolandensis TaxID=2527968 RepID=A0A518G9G5_9BACT|nr:hypothetical protein Q31a_35580 [Aureliella helgolandensis]
MKGLQGQADDQIPPPFQAWPELMQTMGDAMVLARARIRGTDARTIGQLAPVSQTSEPDASRPAFQYPRALGPTRLHRPTGVRRVLHASQAKYV